MNALKMFLDFSLTMSIYKTYLFLLVYGIANLCGLATSCINPVLYGYLNESFRKEYKTFLSKIPWFPTDQSHCNSKNCIEMPPIRRPSPSADNVNHPTTMACSFRKVDKLCDKSKSCIEINNIATSNHDVVDTETKEKNRMELHDRIRQDPPPKAPTIPVRKALGKTNNTNNLSKQFTFETDCDHSVINSAPNEPGIGDDNISRCSLDSMNCFYGRNEKLKYLSTMLLAESTNSNKIVVRYFARKITLNSFGTCISMCSDNNVKLSKNDHLTSFVTNEDENSVSTCSNSKCFSCCSSCTFSSIKCDMKCYYCNCSCYTRKELNLYRYKHLSLPTMIFDDVYRCRRLSLPNENDRLCNYVTDIFVARKEEQAVI